MAPVRMGCCITAHGFGHAARAVAVMEALAQRMDVEFVVVGGIPPWFFAGSGIRLAALHPLQTDVGLVQVSALQEEMTATLAALDRFYPLDPELVEHVAFLFAGCRLVLSDIAPLGLAAAARAGAVSVLVENFTWDWIYEGYLEQWPGLAPHVRYLRQLYRQADLHLQAEPVCRRTDCDLRVAPVSRAWRQPRQRIRQLLGVSGEQRLVLVTMGGVGSKPLDPAPMLARPDLVFVLPGSPVERLTKRENLRLLPFDSGLHHPDLIAAADLVVGKLGYSTLAEVYAAGVPFAYLCRPDFPESAHLAAFVDRAMAGGEIAVCRWRDTTWVDELDTMLLRPAVAGRRENGARQAAGFLARFLE